MPKRVQGIYVFLLYTIIVYLRGDMILMSEMRTWLVFYIKKKIPSILWVK